LDPDIERHEEVPMPASTMSPDVQRLFESCPADVRELVTGDRSAALPKAR